MRNAETGAELPRAQASLPGLGYGGITDVEGRFHMPDLPSGPVAVEVRLLGYGIARREATVVDDSVVVLEVPLTRTVISVAGLAAVGSPSRPRTVTESMVPIDAISHSEPLDQGDTDIDDLLRATIPSYNVNPQATGDAARIIRPANLRGLAPDHTLVLVNGSGGTGRRSSPGSATASPTARRARISRASRPSRSGRWRCCGTAPDEGHEVRSGQAR